MVPPYVSRQAGVQIARGLIRGERKVRLQLHPPELGSIKVEMDVKDHVLKIAMTAENSSVKDALQSGIRELREALVDHGVGFEGVDIRIGYESGRSGEGSGSSSGREGSGFENPEVAALTGEGDETDLSFSRRAGERIVDLVA
jgi:flagellar hook-length control protein FliK